MDNIDTLSYELKYKGDQEVLDLLYAYKDTIALLSTYDEDAGSYKDKFTEVDAEATKLADAISKILAIAEEAL